ncbi:MAG: YhbY family RNA-binding protein [Verrucomicrobiota bacterium]
MNEPLPQNVVRKLKSQAQKLDPMVKVGQAGITEGFLANLDQALARHELIKVRFDAFKDEKRTLAKQMAEQTGSHLVWMVGHVAVFYRQNPDPVQRKISIDKAVP